MCPNQTQTGAGSKIDSVEKQWKPANVPHLLESVEAFDFSEFLKSLPTCAEVVVKMDIEGSEVDVMNHLISTGAMTVIDELYIETHARFLFPHADGEPGQNPYHNQINKIEEEFICELKKHIPKVHKWF